MFGYCQCCWLHCKVLWEQCDWVFERMGAHEMLGWDGVFVVLVVGSKGVCGGGGGGGEGRGGGDRGELFLGEVVAWNIFAAVPFGFDGAGADLAGFGHHVLCVAFDGIAGDGQGLLCSLLALVLSVNETTGGDHGGWLCAWCGE